MNRQKRVSELRTKLKSGRPSIGSWIQLPNSSVAEILGNAGYDWIAVDLEHGSIDVQILPDLFRAIESNNTLPMVRLADGLTKDCKRALDAGAAGVIVPMIESADHLRLVQEACYWPPAGRRGVGFSRANLFGARFGEYFKESQAPFLVAMIETLNAVLDLDQILAVNGLDAILIGPYDLSAALGITGEFDNPLFIKTLDSIKDKAKKARIPMGIHIVDPNEKDLQEKIKEGYQFIPYSIDSVFLCKSSKNPIAASII
jgi:2-dehydro-3-deoxyglucarate aldolase